MASSANSDPKASNAINAIRESTSPPPLTEINQIPVPAITELFCLLSPSGLPPLQGTSGNVVSLRYSNCRPYTYLDTEVEGVAGAVNPDKNKPPPSPTAEHGVGVDTYKVLLSVNDLNESTNEGDLWGVEDDHSHVSIIYIPSLKRQLAERVITASIPAEPMLAGNGFLEFTQSNFTTGLRLRSSGSKHLILFAGMPYLGSPPQSSPLKSTTDNACLTLSQYRRAEGKSSCIDGGVRVWQAWHILFNNSRIALFKSNCDPYSSYAPLFTFQNRYGAFHTMAQLLGNLFLSEDDALLAFKYSVNRYQEQLLHRNLQNEDHKASIANFEERLTDVSTILMVIEEQIKILDDFRRIVDNHHRSPHATSNAVWLPFLSNQKEQIDATLNILQVLIKERTAKMKGLNRWQTELRETLKGLHSAENQNTSIEMNNTLMRQERILARQGQTVTVFTYITAAFLPLGFFSSYLGMNTGVWSGVNSHEEFWRVTGPITIVLLVIFSYFVLRDDDDIKDDIKRILPWNWGSKGKRKEGGNHPEEAGVSNTIKLGSTISITRPMTSASDSSASPLLKGQRVKDQ